MTDVISEYQRWKQQGGDLRAKAKQAMESRFRDLLTEAVQLAEEYRADFGGPLKPPPDVTAFRYKASARKRAKKPGKKAAGGETPSKSAAPAPPKEQAAPKSDRKLAGLQRRLAAAKEKLSAAKAKGAPTRNLEDKIYEIEDQIRLAG